MSAVTTPLRRKLALAAGLLCLGAPVLSSCGFDYATDRPNVISHGGFHIAPNGMRVLATRIVASNDHAGVFIATIALNPTAEPATDAAKAPKLTGVSSRGDSDAQLTAQSFSPIAVTDTGAVNLADPSIGGIPVTGDFSAGDSIPVTLTFSDGTTISVQTPVVTQCHEYASVAPQGGDSSSATTSKGRKAGKSASASASESASAGASDTASAEASGTASPQASDTASSEATGSASPGAADTAAAGSTSAASAPYDCQYPQLPQATD